MLTFIVIVLVAMIGKKLYDKMRKDERICHDMSYIICSYHGVEENKIDLIAELDVAPYIAQEAVDGHNFVLKNTPACPRKFTYRIDSAFALMDYADKETSKGHYYGNLYNACLSFLLTEEVITEKQVVNMKKDFIRILRSKGYGEEIVERFLSKPTKNMLSGREIY